MADSAENPLQITSISAPFPIPIEDPFAEIRKALPGGMTIGQRLAISPDSHDLIIWENDGSHEKK